MHFTFIALTPIVDVSFLSYQYKIFACKLSAMEKQTWWHRERQGLSLQTTHSKPPRASRPLQLLRGTALRACRTWTKPFTHASRSRAGCQIWLARGRQACGNERGKTPRSACDQPPKSRTVCASPSLVGTPAPRTSGTFWAKTPGLDTPCEERWPGEMPLDWLPAVTAAWWAAPEENLPGALRATRSAEGRAPRWGLRVPPGAVMASPCSCWARAPSPHGRTRTSCPVAFWPPHLPRR